MYMLPGIWSSRVMLRSPESKGLRNRSHVPYSICNRMGAAVGHRMNKQHAHKALDSSILFCTTWFGIAFVDEDQVEQSWAD